MSEPVKYKGFREGKRTRRRGNQKDTKRWCKGVVGREHQARWMGAEETGKGSYLSGWYWLICSVCGKQLDWPCYDHPWTKKEQPCRCGNHDRPGPSRRNGAS